MDLSISSILGNSLIQNFVIAFMLGLGGWIYRRKIVSKLKHLYYYSTNRTIIANAKSIYNYDVPESGPVEFEFTDEIEEGIISGYSNKVTNPDVNKKWATFKVEDIPPLVKIRLSERHQNYGADDLEEERPVDKYKIVVEPRDDLVFGYKEMFPLIQFEHFSEHVVSEIESNYFPGATPSSSRVQLLIKKGTPPNRESIDDQKYNIKGKKRDDTMSMTFREPKKLERGLRKYVEF